MPSETAVPAGVPNAPARQPLFVHPVARLVHHAVERHEEIALVVARRQPAVAGREAVAKRVRGRVDRPRREIEPNAPATSRLNAACAATG